MKSLSPKLIAPFPEAHSLALSRTHCVWSCATQTLDFIGRTEISTAVENQQLSRQDVISSRKGSEQVAVWCVIHYLLDLPLVVSYLLYEEDKLGRRRAVIHDHALFEAVANNPHLPSDYKQAMVLRPGAQGNSVIIGEFQEQDSHK